MVSKNRTRKRLIQMQSSVVSDPLAEFIVRFQSESIALKNGHPFDFNSAVWFWGGISLPNFQQVLLSFMYFSSLCAVHFQWAWGQADLSGFLLVVFVIVGVICELLHGPSYIGRVPSCRRGASRQLVEAIRPMSSFFGPAQNRHKGGRQAGYKADICFEHSDPCR